MRSSLDSEQGFTLLELLIVIAIIGILAAVVLVSLGDSRELAKQRAAQKDMRDIHTAMEQMFNHTGLYPHKEKTFCPPRDAAANEVDLSVSGSGLVGTDGSYPNWSGPYVTDVIDPWGTPYFFDEDYFCTAGAEGCKGVTDSSFGGSALVSCGRDKMIGDDVTNPQPNNGIGCAYNDDNVVYMFCRI